MKKLWFATCAALVILPMVFLFEWEMNTLLYFSTGMLAGVVAAQIIEMWRDNRKQNEPR
jgi:hypothetical protein